jgi:hypothetical protein
MNKLTVQLGDRDLAALLVEAGLDTPRKIKAATDKQLIAIPGIGPAKKAKIRARFPYMR